jgi:hypothetical protein
MNMPRIVLWDVENSHNLAAVFQLKHNDYINADNIVRERFLICAAWKELGVPKVHSVSVLDDAKLFKREPFNDRHVITTLHKVLSEADVLVAHNGDEFDLKLTKGRMLVHGLPPLPPILTIDTLKTARSQFLLNANNLNYLGNLLGVGQKKPTKPGLWLQVLRGDRKAIADMVAYNRGDVELLERVFNKLRPYMPNHVNRELFGQAEGACPRCGSLHIQKRGLYRTRVQIYQKYYCTECTGWFRGKQSQLTTRSRLL